MIRHKILVGGAVVLAALLLAVISSASADDGIPEGVSVFRISDCNLVCVVFPDGSGECYECGGQCELPTATAGARNRPLSTPTGTDVEPTLVPSATPAPHEPTNTPRPTVEESPTVQPTGSRPTVEPTEKEHCDKGEGNGEEDCDPGNHPEEGNDDED